MTTKRLYLDVDGVLNAFPYATTQNMMKGVFDFGSEWGGDWARGEANGYIITWAPELVESLNEALAHPDGPELHWTTTWTTLAPEYISPLLGIEVDPAKQFVVESPSNRRVASIVWKMEQIKHRIDQMRDEDTEPLAWVHIDDEMHQIYEDDYYGIHKYVTNAEKSDRGLAIGPNPTFGISPEEWASALKHWEI